MEGYQERLASERNNLTERLQWLNVNSEGREKLVKRLGEINKKLRDVKNKAV